MSYKTPLVMGSHRDIREGTESLGYEITIDGKLFSRYGKEITKVNVQNYDVWQVMYVKGVAKTTALRCNIGVYSAWTGDRETENYNIHHVNHCSTDNHLFNLVKLSTKEHFDYHGRFDRLPVELQQKLQSRLDDLVLTYKARAELVSDFSIQNLYRKFVNEFRYIVRVELYAEEGKPNE